MKKLVKVLGLFTLIGAGIWGAVQYNAYLINNPCLTYTGNYPLNLATTPVGGGITRLSAQAIISTATVAAASFTDGRVSTGTVTVVNPAALLAASATNQITIAATATILAAGATNYLVVLTTSSLSGKIVTYNGNPLTEGVQWHVVDTTTGTAASLLTAINRFYGVTVTRTNSEVDMVAYPAGAATNSKTLAVNTSSITIGGATFGGGHNNRLANSILTVNGIQYPAGYQWKVMDTSSGTATSVAFLLNHIAGIKASASASVVYASATVSGTAGNAFSLVSSAPSYMTVAAATFSGGRSNANVCVNLTCVTQGTDWTAVATASGTAKAISDALTANTAIHSVINSTWTSAGIVSATSTVTGANTNYVLSTNVPSYLTLSHATLVGGQASAFATGTSPITIAAHGFGTGLGVVFSTGTGVTISPLVNGTTYYVGVINANTIALSTTSAGAIAGSYINLGTQSLTGPHTFTLTPQVVTGTATLVWQVANGNCTSWTNLNVSSVTFASPYTAINQSWDFGTVNFQCIRAAFTGPTTGGVNIQVPIAGN